MKRAIVTVVCALLISGWALQAADLSGHWAGKYELARPDGEPVEIPLYLILNQEGDKLTGTAGSSVDERPLTVTGEMKGSNVELELTGGAQPTKITGVLQKQVIKGKSTILTQTGESAKVDVKIKKIS